MEKKSGAYQLVEIVYRQGWSQTSKSWQRLNPSLSGVLSIAITAGVDFAENDFADIFRDFKGEFWFTDSTGGEHFYRHAIEIGHLKAIQSFEKWKHRLPLVVDGSRVFEGRLIHWNGQEVLVTSFDDSTSSFIACAYKKITRYANGSAYGDGKPIKRYKVSWQDLKNARKATKAMEAQCS